MALLKDKNHPFLLLRKRVVLYLMETACFPVTQKLKIVAFLREYDKMD